MDFNHLFPIHFLSNQSKKGNYNSNFGLIYNQIRERFLCVTQISFLIFCWTICVKAINGIYCSIINIGDVNSYWVAFRLFINGLYYYTINIGDVNSYWAAFRLFVSGIYYSIINIGDVTHIEQPFDCFFLKVRIDFNWLNNWFRTIVLKVSIKFIVVFHIFYRGSEVRNRSLIVQWKIWKLRYRLPWNSSYPL